ncbi:BPSL0761 family protein [Paraburkholderia youngii]|uniref:BPSL0761 family protein n=1 Tax=Paraburkholderia youngii TaxID=2782701 RepID=UPI003D20A642
MESAMTTPAERTRSVRGTRQLLVILASHTGQFDHRLVRTLAIQLLRHFPSDADIALSNCSLSTLWGELPGDCSEVSMSGAEESDAKKLCNSARHSQSR